jgi:hypothetical protein
MSILMGIIKGDDYMTEYLKKPGNVITAFPSTNKARARAGGRETQGQQLRRRPALRGGGAAAAQPHAAANPARPSPPRTRPQATRGFMSSISKYAGVALQNETFTRGVFNYMIVPGKAWTLAELAAAAPTELKTLWVAARPGGGGGGARRLHACAAAGFAKRGSLWEARRPSCCRFSCCCRPTRPPARLPDGRPCCADHSRLRSGGERMPVTRDPSVPYGVRINGHPVAIGNQATADKKVALHLVDGTMIPPSSQPQVAWWTAGSPAAAKVAGGGATGAVMEAAKEAAKSGAGARAAAPAAAAAAAAAALALLL